MYIQIEIETRVRIYNVNGSFEAREMIFDKQFTFINKYIFIFCFRLNTVPYREDFIAQRYLEEKINKTNTNSNNSNDLCVRTK